jgi:hypothetical protein
LLALIAASRKAGGINANPRTNPAPFGDPNHKTIMQTKMVAMNNFKKALRCWGLRKHLMKHTTNQMATRM